MSNLPALARLDKILKHELLLYERYLTLIEQERELVPGNHPENLESLSGQRQEVLSQMRQWEEQRLGWMHEIPGGKSAKLTELLTKYYHPKEITQIVAQAKRLKELVLHTKRASMELGQVVNYALNLVNGQLSIIWSATREVVRSYTPEGVIRESSHGRDSRLSGLLTQA